MKKLFSLIFVSFLIVHCSSLKKRGDSDPSVRTAEDFEQGEELHTFPPQISNPSAKKIGLVFGAGGARTLAYAGLIRSLKKNKIEISHIAATEWSSLVAASFALSGEVHDMDWKLYKLEGLDLKFDKGFLGLRSGQASTELTKYFTDNFSGLRLESAKIPFFCATRGLGASQSALLSRGAAAQALQRCLPSPPFFNSFPQASSSASLLKLAAQLKKNGVEVIVFVDVLDPSVLNESQLKEDAMLRFVWGQILENHESAALFIKDSFKLNLKGISVFDFSKRKQLESEGESQGEEIARKLIERYRL